MVDKRRRMKDGSALIVVVLVLVVAGIGTMIYFANQHNQRKRMLNYQRELAAQKAAEEARAAAAAQAERDKAAADAEAEKAEAAEAARKAAQKAADEKKTAEKKAKITRFEDADQAFIGAQAEMWTEGTAANEPTWCLVPGEGGEGRIFEILPAAAGGSKVVKTLGENHVIETMTFELFQTRYLSGEANWFVLRDGKALLKASKRSENALADKFSVPDDGRNFDIAEHLYGDAAKAVKVYKMTPPPLKWNVAFVTQKGVTVNVGTVGFGEVITRDLFRPAVKKLVVAAAAKMQAERVTTEKGKRTVASSFTPSKKRTHFLYDKGTIKRTVEGLIYVPRQYKAARKEFSRNERQRQQDEDRQAARKAEWQALYDEALRQAKEEAAERAQWERARTTASTAKAVSDIPEIVVEPAHIEQALNAGTFIFSPAKSE